MSKIEKFEDLEVCKNGVELSTLIYQTLKDCRYYSFKDQICRATVSIPSNIAEGFERQYNKGFIQHLYIAKGSAGEARTQLLIGKNLNYINVERYDELKEKTMHISRQLFNLIRFRKDKF